MRMRGVLAVAAGFVLVVGAAVTVTAVRSEAKESGRTTATAVSLARATATASESAGSTVTVPALGAAAQSTPDTAAIASSLAAASSAADAEASSAEARSEAARAESSSAAASSAAAGSAAASSSAASSAASQAAASKAAAESSAKAAASSAAVASQAAASKAAASQAAASKAAASQAAASQAAAEASAKAEAASAAAHPAPDTSTAVQEAVDQAADSGIRQSVVVMNRQTGSVTTSIDADRAVPSMSLVKLFLAADVIDQAGGVDDVSEDTLEQLHQMIIASDDSIAQEFYDDDGQGEIITRMADRYNLEETSPSPEARYWGDVQITAHDQASFLYQLLSDSETSAWFTEAMQESLDTGADGFDQNFGVNSVPGAGSKQGWGCCLGSVMAIHSMGFTANQIIVVLSTAQNDVSYTKLGTAQELTDDPGAQASVASVTHTVDAALPPS